MKKSGRKPQKQISSDSESSDVSDVEISENKTSDDESEYESKSDDPISTDSDNESDSDSDEEELEIPPDEDLSHDDMFKILDLYFQQDGILYSHHSNSFDKLLEEDIPRYVKETENMFYEKITKDTIYRNKFVIDDVGVSPPMMDNDLDFMYPSDSRHYNKSYMTKIVARVRQILETIDIITGNKTVKEMYVSEKNINIMTIPMMVKSKYCNMNTRQIPEKISKECPWDPGNYFIINGNEKVIIPLQRKADNKILAFIKNDPAGDIYTAEVNSKDHSSSEGNIQTTTIRYKKDKSMTIKAPMYSTEMSVFSLLRALGLETDIDIINGIVQDPLDQEMINEVGLALEKSKNDNKEAPILTQIDAYNYVLSKLKPMKRYFESDKIVRSEQKRIHLNFLLDRDFIPHIGEKIEGISAQNRLSKAYYICMMVQKIMCCYLKRIDPDDRDNYVNKRIETTGELLFQVIKQHYKKMLNECQKFFGARNNDNDVPINIIEQIKAGTVEQGLRQAIMSGNWGIKGKKGVAQVLQRLSYLQTISYMRRVNSPTDPTIKLTSPRHVHVSQWQFCGPAESPEGGKIGLVTNLSLTATLTLTMSEQIRIIKDIVNPYINKFTAVHPYEFKRRTKVLLNGEPLGLIKENQKTKFYPVKLYQILIDHRTNGIIRKEVSIRYDTEKKEIRLFCDSGRFIRPVIRIGENNSLLLTKKHISSIMLDGIQKDGSVSKWSELLSTYPQIIQYIDVDETEGATIAMFVKDVIRERTLMNTMIKQENVEAAKLNRYDGFVFRRYTHLEIHPSMMTGVVIANTPWYNSNQSPKNVSQYQYARQAMGVYISNYLDRTDISYVLSHPQEPLCGTRIMKYLHTDKLPAGENLMVAIMCYSGYNIEDGIIINQSAVDRGMMAAVYLKKVLVELKKNASTSQDDKFGIPNSDIAADISDADYSLLNAKGYVPAGVEVKNGTAIIGKLTPQHVTDTDVKPYKDTSTFYKSNIPGMIDRVYDDLVNNDGYPMLKMRVSSSRVPSIGDKFACYDEETEILTDKGWIYFNSLTTKHKVASLKNGKELIYENPSKVYEYDYDGKMYQIKSNKIDLLVTPNHNMYVSTKTKRFFKFERAEDILGKVRLYKKNCDKFKGQNNPMIKLDEKNGDKFILPGFIKNNKLKSTVDNIIESELDLELDLEAWCIFYGIWIAEGCMLRDWGISIAANKKRVKKALEKCAETFNMKIHKHKGTSYDNTRNNWCFNDKRFVEYFETQNYGAIDKRLDHWCFDLDNKYAKILLNGLVLGDGEYMKNTTTQRYYTSSVELKDDIQRLGIHAAVCVEAKKRKGMEKGKKQIINGKVSHLNAQAWIMTIVETQTEPKVNKNKAYGKQQDKMINYNGKVYCCTVTSSILYVRRKGLVMWSGNSKNAQKGTCGILYRQEDMPFTLCFDKNGNLTQVIIPDFIINPNAIPSRMTIAQIIEGMAGKYAARTGIRIDGTPFCDINIEQLGDLLEECGFSRYGDHIMINGQTGKEFAVTVYITPCFYQRLKHLVFDKIHARAMGPRQTLTRQPTEGRARDGGFRLGEMERMK
jgi:DNA-directed RNA polymerase II subunit RPB2